MEQRKITLDREPLSSEYIQGKQDFNHALKGHRTMKPPLWKTAWFYGPVGLAVVAITISAVKFNPTNNSTKLYGSNITLKESIYTPSQKNIIASVSHSETDASVVQRKSENSVSPTPAKVETPKQEQVSSVQIVEESEVIITGPVVSELPVSNVEKTLIDGSKKEVITSKNTMPSIAGVFMGNITSNQLCSPEGIVLNDEWDVIRFSIQYNNGVQEVVEKINGSAIPSSICWKVHKFNRNIPVFITEIVAVDQTGSRKIIPSMSVTPVF